MNQYDALFAGTAALCVLGLAALCVVTLKNRKTRNREKILLAILKKNPDRYFGVTEVSREMGITQREARTVINSLRGDQSWGWALSNTPDPVDGGYRVFSSASSIEWRLNPS